MATITYSELAKRLDACKLFNKALALDPDFLYEGLENGNLWVDSENEEVKEIFQYYLITPWDANYLKYNTDELVFYSEVLDEYIWGLTHFGTSWDDVELEIKE